MSKAPSKKSAKPAAPKAKAPPSTSKVPAPPVMNPRPLMGVDDKTSSDAAGPVLKKQELLEKVVRVSGIKKKDAKPVVEAMLEVMGEALADGREFNLQPMGKLKLNRTKETPNARIIVAKIRQPKKGNKPDTPPMATAAE